MPESKRHTPASGNDVPFRSRLLRETAEVALTRIKRLIEEKLSGKFSLRRVSAPLFLPSGSPLLDPRWPGVTVPPDVEIVGSLDLWLRDQLRRYDVAPGFGVFTIMNAFRPQYRVSSVTSPHVAAWAWQQVMEGSGNSVDKLKSVAREIYDIMLDVEKMILDTFPHLQPTLHRSIESVSTASMPENHRQKAWFKISPDTSGGCCGEIWVWNANLGIPLQIADITLFPSDTVGPASIGGNIYRDMLALQVLQQDSLLMY